MSDRIEIDLNGDLILLVGEESGQIRMRVSSSVLSATSPMFQNMLSGRFKEGNSLDSEDPEEIPLPEDYAVTVEVFCNIAHQNGSKVPSQLSPHELLLFAEFVDKHQCQSSFDFHLRAWIEAALAGAPTATDLQFILEACFLLDRPQAFWKVSGRLATMIDPTWQYDMDSPMPREAMMELALQASKAQQFIRQAVERKIANLARDHDNDCQRGKLRLGNVVQHFQVNDLWATDSQPDFPGAWLARLSKCRDFWYYEQCPTCVGEDIMGGGFQDLREAITKGLEICKGLCLDCVKARRTKSDGTCRVKHK